MFKDISLLQDPTKQVLQVLHLSMGNLFSTEFYSQYFITMVVSHPEACPIPTPFYNFVMLSLHFSSTLGYVYGLHYGEQWYILPVQLWENHLLQNTKEDQT